MPRRCYKRDHFTAVCNNTQDESFDCMQVLFTKVVATTDIPDGSSESETEMKPVQMQAARHIYNSDGVSYYNFHIRGGVFLP